MTKYTPAEGAARLRDGIARSGTSYEAGIKRVTVNPAELAIRANDKWKAAMQDAIANDRFAKGLQGITLTDWMTATVTYGVPRYASSAAKAGTNYEKFARVFYPYLSNMQQQVANMPDNNLQDSINRMIFAITTIAQFKNL